MQVNMEGVAVGIVALVMIGVFHPIVIKCEYYFSHRIWPLFLAAGIGFLLAALFTEGMLSMILGLAGVSCLWSIRELQEQAQPGREGMVSQESKPKRAYGLHQITGENASYAAMQTRSAAYACAVRAWFSE